MTAGPRRPGWLGFWGLTSGWQRDSFEVIAGSGGECYNLLIGRADGFLPGRAAFPRSETRGSVVEVVYARSHDLVAAPGPPVWGLAPRPHLFSARHHRSDRPGRLHGEARAGRPLDRSRLHPISAVFQRPAARVRPLFRSAGGGRRGSRDPALAAGRAGLGRCAADAPGPFHHHRGRAGCQRLPVPGMCGRPGHGVAAAELQPAGKPRHAHPAQLGRRQLVCQPQGSRRPGPDDRLQARRRLGVRPEPRGGRGAAVGEPAPRGGCLRRERHPGPQGRPQDRGGRATRCRSASASGWCR